MSDIQQGPDWWLASDGRWYPPAAPAQSGEDAAVDKTPAIVAAAAGALIVVGSIMPWATLTAPFVGQVDVRGTESDGKWTLLLGLVIGAQGLILRTSKTDDRRGVWIALGILGLMVAGVGVVDASSISSSFESNEYVSVSVGPGVYLVAVGGATAAIAAYLRLFRRDRGSTESGQDELTWG